jgi:hypothetical protein
MFVPMLVTKQANVFWLTEKKDTNVVRPAKKQLSIFTKFYQAAVLVVKSVAFYAH